MHLTAEVRTGHSKVKWVLKNENDIPVALWFEWMFVIIITVITDCHHTYKICIKKWYLARYLADFYVCYLFVLTRHKLHYTGETFVVKCVNFPQMCWSWSVIAFAVVSTELILKCHSPFISGYNVCVLHVWNAYIQMYAITVEVLLSTRSHCHKTTCGVYFFSKLKPNSWENYITRFI